MSKGGFRRKMTEDEERLIKAKADIEEMKASEKAEKLIDAASVEKEWTDMCLGFRNKMIAIPSAVAVEVAEETSARRVEEILRREIYDALSKLSKGE